MTINELLTELIDIGKDEAFDRLPVVIASSKDHRSGKFMRQSPGYWTDLAADLSAQEIIALIRALTVAERDVPQMKSGSVSPVIWLYKHLRQRFPGKYTELDEWILRHTDNYYLPWGSANHGARSLDEYRRLSGQVEQRREERRTAEESRQTEAKDRKARKATHDLFGAIKRKDTEAILGLRRKGGDVNATDGFGKSVLELARDTGDPNVIASVTSIIEEGLRRPNNQFKHD